MVGNVHIIGQIGIDYNEDGTIKTNGVELLDVVSQIEPLKDCENINVWINSGGGSVHVGTQIAEYLATKSNITTIADGFCASIATKIHLAVPFEKRKVVSGTDYMIHNPLMPEISNANTNDLKDILDLLQPIQDDLVKMYVQSTSMSKEATQGLMNIEASLTEDQLVSLGFVSEIINKVQMRAVAFIDQKKQINKINTMSKSNFKAGLIASAKAVLAGRKISAIMQDVEQGTIETLYDDIIVGDAIFLGEEPAPADTYVLSDGTQLVVTEVGIVGEIISADGEQEDTAMVEMQAKFDALTAENESLKAVMNTMEKEHETLLEVVNAKKEVKSVWTPPANKVVGKKASSTVDRVAELNAFREELKSKKK